MSGTTQKPEGVDADEPTVTTLSRRARGWAAVLALAALAGAEVPHLGPTSTFGALIYMRVVNWADYERRLSSPGTGLEILPPTITGAAALLREQHVDHYRLAPQLANDAFLLQRISEVTWPAQVDPQAPFVLRLEAEPAACTTVATQSGVSLDRCD